MTTKESIVSVPMKKFFEYMKQLPQFMWDHRFETTESGTLSHNSAGPAQKRIKAEPQDGLLVTAFNPTTGGYSLILDIDVPVEVVKSSSGNTHLYFDVWMSKEQHDTAVAGLRDAGVIQEMWANTAIDGVGGGHLRPPWVKKGLDETMAQREHVRSPAPVGEGL
jgi:hypothetical protein